MRNNDASRTRSIGPRGLRLEVRRRIQPSRRVPADAPAVTLVDVRDSGIRSRPLLLVDVDGVISLFGFDWSDPPPGRPITVDGLPHWISSAAGPLLRRLAAVFELVWCTGWEDRAPEHLPVLLGLDGPAFPHLVFGGPQAGERHWKLAAIEAHAGPERAVAWIDDGFDDTCHAWAAERPGATLLVATDPAVGITEAPAAELAAWAEVVSP